MKINYEVVDEESIMELQNIHKEILTLCADDDTGLWLVLKRIFGEEYYWGVIPERLRQTAMNIIRDMLKDNLIMAGNFEKEDTGKYKFVPILLPADRIIEFIEHEWASLGKTPNIGEVCWFRATASGENLAKELNLI